MFPVQFCIVEFSHRPHDRRRKLLVRGPKVTPRYNSGKKKARCIQLANDEHVATFDGSRSIAQG